MTETMRDANGVGLAAIQIGEAIRMMVMDELYDQEEKGESIALINPVVLSEEEEPICPRKVVFPSPMSGKRWRGP